MKDGMRSSVVFYGHVGKERIMRFYTEALLGVFPSHAEAFALVPMEAMSVGCPVIYSNTTSGQELIEDGVDGVLCDPYNYKDIAVKIISLLNDKKSLEMLGQAGRKKIARNFNRNLILQKNLKLYEKLLYK
jgi:glycosyltransferase involved in cell wall biosynthesis